MFTIRTSGAGAAEPELPVPAYPKTLLLPESEEGERWTGLYRSCIFKESSARPAAPLL